MSIVRSPRFALGVTALAGLTALGGVGVAMSNDGAAVNGAGASPMSITGVATTSSQPTSPKPAPGDATSQLFSMLPAGFDKKNCSPPDQPVPGATADIVCGGNSLGPTMGEFVLFSDPAVLQQTFLNWTQEDDELTPCPGFQQSPADWFYDKSKPASGKIACGTMAGEPDVLWTENETLMLGNIGGGSIQTLMDYWKSPGGPATGKKNHT